MKLTIIFLLAMFLFFGCIEISPKQQDTNNVISPDENTIIPGLPDPDLNEFVQDEDHLDANAPTEPVDEAEPLPITPPSPPPVAPPAEPPPIIPPPPVTPPPALKKGWVELTVNTSTTDVYEGDFVEVDGNQSFSGMVFRVFVERILNTGTEFAARFRIETGQGLEMGKNTFVAGDDVSFEDPNGDQISIDAVLVVERIFAG